MIYFITIIVLLLFILVMILLSMKLYKKVVFYEQWYIAFHHRITYAYEIMKSVDIRGAFEADDEVGDVFKTIKSVIDDVNKFVE